MTTELTFIGLFMEASLVVQLIMLSLMAISIVSWSFIFQRRNLFRATQSQLHLFEERFWGGADLNNYYQELMAQEQVSGIEHIFCAGFKEYVRLRKAQADADTTVEGAARGMRIALSREIDNLEAQLPFLATAGSVSPYIGLFGTVWGIMNAFIALGQVQQATLAMVAPGIAEALIATAIGLFAAIPAVIAFNRFSNQAAKFENAYLNFTEEFTAVLHRQAIRQQEQ